MKFFKRLFSAQVRGTQVHDWRVTGRPDEPGISDIANGMYRRLDIVCDNCGETRRVAQNFCDLNGPTMRTRCPDPLVQQA